MSFSLSDEEFQMQTISKFNNKVTQPFSDSSQLPSGLGLTSQPLAENSGDSIDGESAEILPLYHDESLMVELNQIENASPPPPLIISDQVVKERKTKKNSNVLKKMGRMILKNKHRYSARGKRNEGVDNMMKLFEGKTKKKNNMKKKNIMKDLVDGFNTRHLKSLFNECSEETASENLRVTKELFNKNLRSQVFSSSQIKEDSQYLLYLNTLKCSSLRLSGKTLALRLQSSLNE